MTIFYILLAFFAGALPFSVWVGQWGLKTDIRAQGDHNPGCTNVLRAGGWRWGAVALGLDALKGAIPVGGVYWGGLGQGWPLVIIALAPILGHAFSPFLAFRGGKAVAVTFGVWAGLTLWEAPTVLGVALGVWFALMAIDGWAMLLAMMTLGLYLGVTHSPFMPIWFGNTLIIAWKHQADLRQWPRFRHAKPQSNL